MSDMLKGRSPRPYQPGRAGGYGPTKGGWRAFHPKPLPPNPPLELSSELLSALLEASTELGRLDGVAEILPDPDFFVYSYVRKEAVLSSQIEGTRSSLVDVLEFEAGAERRTYPRDVHEVVNYIRALNTALRRVRGGEPVSLALLKETHDALLQGVRGGGDEPGQLKTKQNWIGPLGSSPATADYIPPPPEETPAAMNSLISYIQSEASNPPLLRASFVHSQFETIHPFLDGNGRIGRLLVTLLLAKWGLLRRPVLYLSYFFLKNRDEYTRRLQGVRDDGDWEGWVEFFLRGVLETSTQATETARRILSLRSDHESQVVRTLGVSRAGSGQALVRQLFRQPVVSINDVTKLLGVSFPTAGNLVDDFVRLGLLVEITGQKRNRYFRYQPYIDVLQYDAPVAPGGGSSRVGNSRNLRSRHSTAVP